MQDLEGSLVHLLRYDDATRQVQTLMGLGSPEKKIGAGKRTGYGGKMNPSESAATCASRELEEECGLSADSINLKKAAIIDFHNIAKDGSPFIFRVHVYLAWIWWGELRPSQPGDEMPIFLEEVNSGC